MDVIAFQLCGGYPISNIGHDTIQIKEAMRSICDNKSSVQ